jgi:hypothetical protein
MALPNIFTSEVSQEIIQRINLLQKDSQPLWGQMSVAQMLAHCCVTYELVYEDKHPKPNFLLKFFLKSFVKNFVVNEVRYKQSLKTAPAFIITEQKDFEYEKID